MIDRKISPINRKYCFVHLSVKTSTDGKSSVKVPLKRNFRTLFY